MCVARLSRLQQRKFWIKELQGKQWAALMVEFWGQRKTNSVSASQENYVLSVLPGFLVEGIMRGFNSCLFWLA